MTALIELYANNAYSTLSGAISNTATSLTLATGTGSRFPSPVVGAQFFRLDLTSASSPNTIFEIVYVTQRSGDTLTIQRGQEGSTAQAWAIGDLCGNEPTAGMFNQFVQPWVGTDTGVANAYVVSTPQHESAYYSGMPCTFTTIHASTSTAPTLNLNSLGAATIKNADGTAILSGQIPANTPISVVYNSADTSWRLQSPIGIPTGLIPGRAAGIDPSGRITSALSTLVQLNMLSNWAEPIQSQIGSPGFTIGPQGVLMQWATGTSSTSGDVVTFAEAFPNAINTVFISISTADSVTLAGNGYCGYQILNNQQVKIFSVNGTPAVSVMAIGY